MKRVNALLIFFLFLGLSAAVGQTLKVDNKASNLTIAGTSTLHDWIIDARQLQGTAQVSETGDKLKIESLQLQVPVKSLDSGKGAMDKNTYEALEADKHPQIQFQLTDVLEVTEEADCYQVKARGKLSIAGTSKTVSMQVKATVKDGVQFSGSLPLKMTDFNIDPPTAVFGTIKTGDEITINFNVAYQ